MCTLMELIYSIQVIVIFGILLISLSSSVLSLTVPSLFIKTVFIICLSIWIPSISYGLMSLLRNKRRSAFSSRWTRRGLKNLIILRNKHWAWWDAISTKCLLKSTQRNSGVEDALIFLRLLFIASQYVLLTIIIILTIFTKVYPTEDITCW